MPWSRDPAIAAEAGTTRQALYRRWPTLAALVAGAVAGFDDGRPARSVIAAPFEDLVRELADFRRGPTSSLSGEFKP